MPKEIDLSKIVSTSGLISMLKNVQKLAQQTDSALANMGKRNSLDGFIGTIESINNSLTELQKNGNSTLASLGDALNGSLGANIQLPTQNINDFLNKISSALDGLTKIDLSSNTAQTKEQIIALINEVNEAFNSIGIKSDVDINKRLGVKKLFDTLVNQFDAFKDVKIQFGSPEQIDDADIKLKKQIEEKIKGLEAEKAKYQKVMRSFDDLNDPNYKIQLKPKQEIDILDRAYDKYDEAKNKIFEFDGEIDTNEYKQIVLEYVKISNQLFNTLASIKKEDPAYSWIKSNIQRIKTERQEYQELFDDNKDILKQYKADVESKITEINSEILKIKTPDLPEYKSTNNAKQNTNVMYHHDNLYPLLHGNYKSNDSFGNLENLTKSAKGTRLEQYGHGVLGGGIFGVNDPSHFIDNVSMNGSRFITSIDLSKYNMYLADTEERATALMDFLSKLQKFSIKSSLPGYTGFDEQLNNITEDELYQQFQNVFVESDLTKTSFCNFINQMVELLKGAGIKFNEAAGNLEFSNISKELESSDNISTRFMKMLGYQGVNVGATSFDGMGQGSVLYELNPEDIVGYFHTIEQAIEDYQKLVSQSPDNLWSGSIEQLQQYKDNIVEIIAQLKTKKIFPTGALNVEVDEAIKALEETKAKLEEILSNSATEIRSDFANITKDINNGVQIKSFDEGVNNKTQVLLEQNVALEEAVKISEEAQAAQNTLNQKIQEEATIRKEIMNTQQEQQSLQEPMGSAVQEKTLTYYENIKSLMLEIQEIYNKGINLKDRFLLPTYSNDGVLQSVGINGTDIRNNKPTQASIKRQIGQYDEAVGLDNGLLIQKSKEALVTYVAAFQDAVTAEKLFGAKHKELYNEIISSIDRATAAKIAYRDIDIKRRALLSNAREDNPDAMWRYRDSDELLARIQDGNIDSAMSLVTEVFGKATTAINEQTQAYKENTDATALNNAEHEKILEQPQALSSSPFQNANIVTPSTPTETTPQSATISTGELQQLENLKAQIEAVKQAVVEKTQAFSDEGAVVHEAVSKETESLNGLLAKINEVTEATKQKNETFGAYQNILKEEAKAGHAQQEKQITKQPEENVGKPNESFNWENALLVAQSQYNIVSIQAGKLGVDIQHLQEAFDAFSVDKSQENLQAFNDQLKLLKAQIAETRVQAKNDIKVRIGLMLQNGSSSKESIEALLNEYANGISIDDSSFKGIFKNYTDAREELQKELSNGFVPKNGQSDDEYNRYLQQLVDKTNEASKLIQSKIKSALKIEKADTLNIENFVPIDKNDISSLEANLRSYVEEQNLGAIETIKFNEQSGILSATVKDAAGNLIVLRVAASEAGDGVKLLGKETKLSASNLEGWQRGLLGSANSLKSLFAAFTGFYGIRSLGTQLRQGVTYVKELDAALTELRKVTEGTDDTYKRFLSDASSTSARIGTTITEFTNATSDFARLGFSIQDASKLAEAASIYTNVGDDVNSISDATESIISTMKAFRLEADGAMDIVSRFNEVGNNFAISSGGIGDALKNSASALYEAGNDINESIALITAANAVVQNPASVGTALKTLSLRLRGAKVDLEDAGLETDNMANSVSELRNKLLALTGGQVDIMFDDKNFKNSTEILREMSAVWEELSDVSRAAALELMGGKRQANILSAIITNFDMVEDVIETSANSAGSALRENEKYLNSIQGKADQFANAMQTMWSHFIDSELVKSFYGELTNIIRLFDRFGSAGTIAFGSVATAILSVVGSGLGMWFKSLGTENQIILFSALGKAFSKSFSQIRDGFSAVTNIFKTGEISTGGLLTMCALLSVGIIKLGDSIHNWLNPSLEHSKEEWEEFQSQLNLTKNEIETLESKIKSISEQIDALQKKGTLSFTDEQEVKRLEAERKQLESQLNIQNQILKAQQEQNSIKSKALIEKTIKQGAYDQKNLKKITGLAGLVGGTAIGFTVAQQILGALAAPLTGGLSLLASAALTAGVTGVSAVLFKDVGEKIADEALGAETATEWAESYDKALAAKADEVSRAQENYISAINAGRSGDKEYQKWQDTLDAYNKIQEVRLQAYSDMQNYVANTTYSEADSKFLDDLNLVLDKFAIDNNSPNAKFNFFDRIFDTDNNNLSNKIQEARKEILDIVNNSDLSDVSKKNQISAYLDNGSDSAQELSKWIADCGLEVSELLDYLLKVGDYTPDTTGGFVAQIQSLTSLTDILTKYSNVQTIVNNLSVENTRITEEQFNAIKELIQDESALGECIDSNNGYIVTNIDLLKDLLATTKQNNKSQLELSRSQARLKYNTLAKQINNSVKSFDTLDDAQRNNLSKMFDELDALEKTISRFNLLEQQLDGVTDAYTRFAEAQNVDESLKYDEDISSMVSSLVSALEHGEFTEASKVAWEALVPKEIYEQFDTVEERMKAVWEYATKILPDLFTYNYDNKGFIAGVSIEKENVEAFVKRAQEVKAFTGSDFSEFTINTESFKDGIVTLDEMADKLGMTKEAVFAFITECDKYNAEWVNGKNGSLWDYFDNGLEGRIYNTTQALADYNREIVELYRKQNQGTISADEFENKKAEIYAKIAEENAKLDGYVAEAQRKVNAYVANRKDLDTAKKHLSELNTELNEIKKNKDGISDRALEIQIKAKTEEINEASDKLNKIIARTETPTVLEIETALDFDVTTEDVQAKLLEVKSQINETMDKKPANLKVVPQFDEKTNELLNADEISARLSITQDPEEKAFLQQILDLSNKANTIQLYINTVSGNERKYFEEVQSSAEAAYNAINHLQSKYTIDTSSAIKNLNAVKTKATELKTALSMPTVNIPTTTSTSKTTHPTPYASRSNADGTAHATGNWGLKHSEQDALVGELGQETVVDPHTGKYYTVGDSGAEFVDLPKDAIIFNHKQTEQLFKNGHINSRGRALAEGNAHVQTISFGPSQKVTKSTSGNSKSSSNNSSEDTAEELIDFIEYKLEEIENDIAQTTNRVENYIDNTADINSKNQSYDELIRIERERSNTYEQAFKVYEAKAESLLSDIPSQYREMAKNGAIAITDFIGENETKIADSIQKYREFAQKAADVQTKHLESIAQISAYSLERLKDIATDFENLTGLTETRNGLIESEMNVITSSGGRVSESFYEQLISNSKNLLDIYQSEFDALNKSFKADVVSGALVKGSDDWYEALNTLSDVAEKINECKQNTNEWNKALREVKWNNLELLVKELDNVDSQLSHLEKIFSDENEIVDEFGNWTQSGVTAIAMLAQQMELAKYSIEQYDDAIAMLERDFANGLYSEDEYNEKLIELTENQWKSIESYDQSKKAIVSLNKTRVSAVKDGIKKEIDAYKELIELKKESLQTDKNTRDFEKSVAEQRKNISTIEKQLAAITGDTSASATAKRKQLQADLIEAQNDLNDTYYEHSIDTQIDALDKEYGNYEKTKQKEMDALDEWLKDSDKVVSDSLNTMFVNTSDVLAQLNNVASEYSIQIADAITYPWIQGTEVLDTYRNKLQEIKESQSGIIQGFSTSANDSISTMDSSINSLTSIENNPVPIGESSSYVPNISSVNRVSDISGLIKSGQKGNDVATLQEALIALGYSCGSTGVDGVFGKNTLSAVKKFQSDNGITADGIVGPNTKEKFRLKGFARGTVSAPKSGLAILDELGEELQLVPDGNGRLAYVAKGTGILNKNLTERLMEWGELDPTEVLNHSVPKVNAPHIITNNFNVDLSFGSLVTVGTVTQDTLPDLQNFVRKEFDNMMKQVNNKLYGKVR